MLVTILKTNVSGVFFYCIYMFNDWLLCNVQMFSFNSVEDCKISGGVGQTCLVLEGVASNYSIGFCWEVPVYIDAVQMPLLDSEESGGRWHCRQQKSRRWWSCDLLMLGRITDLWIVNEQPVLPPSGVEKSIVLLGGPSYRLFATTIYIL